MLVEHFFYWGSGPALASWEWPGPEGQGQGPAKMALTQPSPTPRQCTPKPCAQWIWARFCQMMKGFSSFLTCGSWEGSMARMILEWARHCFSRKVWTPLELGPVVGMMTLIRKTHSYLNLLKSYLNTYFSRFKKQILSRVLLI